MEYHIPVLLTEVLNQLQIEPGKIYIDATLGNGGHTVKVLELGGVVYGIENDPENLIIAKQRIEGLGLSANFHPIKGNFYDLDSIINQQIKQPISGLLLDLGLSSNQQKAPGRGFSFNDNLSLDMRLDPTIQTLTAEEIINTYSYDELFEIFSKIGQETLSKLLIKRIISARQRQPIKNGSDLANIVRDLYKQKGSRSKIDPSTKIFMALRITVNQEYENLKNVLEVTTSNPLLKTANICIISFHSGEDRLVKQFIRQNNPIKITTINHKAISPSHNEIIKNPLSRSAVLRSYRIN